MAKDRILFDSSKLPVWYHPGEMLNEKLHEMGISVRDFADKVSLREETVLDIMSSASPIDDRIASVLELGTQIPARMWLRTQLRYNDYLKRQS